MRGRKEEETEVVVRYPRGLKELSRFPRKVIEQLSFARIGTRFMGWNPV